MRAATHHGTCQVCGHYQLLPNGKLSLHGYAVRWSQFVGTCPGSKHLPFEQDKTLVDQSITRAQNDIKQQEAYAAELRQPAEGNATWLSLYRPATWTYRKSGYEWRKVELTRNENPKTFKYANGTEETIVFVDFSFLNPITEKVQTKSGNELISGLGYRPTLAEAINAGNALKAKQVHDRAAKELALYVKWQQERIANWAPKALTPREVTA